MAEPLLNDCRTPIHETISFLPIAHVPDSRQAMSTIVSSAPGKLSWAPRGCQWEINFYARTYFSRRVAKKGHARVYITIVIAVRHDG